MIKKLEDNLRKIEVTKEKLKQVMIKIDNYHKLVNPHGDNDIRIYKSNLDARENLTTNLNYYQNQVIIGQNGELIKYLKELKK